MEFEFGTNWAMYSRFVGDVFGSALAAEGIFAFFLESGFLAVLVFGWDRVRPEVPFLRDADGRAGVDVFRCLDHGRQQLAADAGRASDRGDGPQRPALHARRDGRLLGVVFNPSTVDRLRTCGSALHPRRVLHHEHLGVVPAEARHEEFAGAHSPAR